MHYRAFRDSILVDVYRVSSYIPRCQLGLGSTDWTTGAQCPVDRVLVCFVRVVVGVDAVFLFAIAVASVAVWLLAALIAFAFPRCLRRLRYPPVDYHSYSGVLVTCLCPA